MSKYDEGPEAEPVESDSLAGESFSRESPEERQQGHDVEPAHHDDEGFRHTRTSAAWVAVVVAVIFGIALIDFIAQNTRHVRIEFFTASGRIPVAVALLAAALSGAIVVVAIGVGRVAQLRLKIRRQRRWPKTESTGVHNERGHGVVSGSEEP
ncbi:MAG TPA: lipopolysaccharide assembly protein LapA domain-containing protein [Acidimicrobiales bacterium]|nr:lipopolysaccharide assembly protein LapA domain-containing protein [Acidimicrobiales bacterium]